MNETRHKLDLGVQIGGMATLCVAMLAGCASPWHGSDSRDLPSIRSSVPQRFLPSPKSVEQNDAVESMKSPYAAVTSSHRPATPVDVEPQRPSNPQTNTVSPQPVVRGQNAVRQADYWMNEDSPDGSNRLRRPMVASGNPVQPSVVPAVGGVGPTTSPGSVQPAQFTNPAVGQQAADVWGLPAPPGGYAPQGAMPAPGVNQVPPGYNPNAAYQVPGSPPMTNVPPSYGPPSYPAPSAANPSASPNINPYANPNPYAGNPYAGPPGPIPGQFGPVSPPPGTALGGPFDPRVGAEPGGVMGVPTPLTDIFVNVQETQTGRLMLGAAVNSDAGVTGQFVIDERNFDWRRVPRSWDDVFSGSAFRGAGQGFRLEALPGSQVQRYMLQYTDPYLMNTRISMNLSGYLFDRQYLDWDEQRLGGRLGFGYRITPDLSVSFMGRAEQITISGLRTNTSAELNAVEGDHDLFSGRFSIVQDTRDIPFQPTQGYYLELNYEQVFGSFDYPRGEIDFRRYFLLAERPDGSGRHVLGFSNRYGFSGSDTPVFENFFAGGYSTLRGFDFRGASPRDGDVVVGGEFQMLGSVEYLFPITADDMLKGVAFCDYGTVEKGIEFNAENYRVTLGMGLRVFVPAMGPAPIALDFGVPVARAEEDRIQQFSFFIGVSR